MKEDIIKILKENSTWFAVGMALGVILGVFCGIKFV